MVKKSASDFEFQKNFEKNGKPNYLNVGLVYVKRIEKEGVFISDFVETLNGIAGVR